MYIKRSIIKHSILYGETMYIKRSIIKHSILYEVSKPTLCS